MLAEIPLKLAVLEAAGHVAFLQDIYSSSSHEKG